MYEGTDVGAVIACTSTIWLFSMGNYIGGLFGIALIGWLFYIKWKG